MNLEQAAAQAFLEELEKISQSSDDEGTKTAAAGLFESLDEEHVVQFLKEAGLGDMLGGIGRGLGALGMGAARGAGSMVAGTARGVGGAIGNAAGRVGGALKAAPGAIGAKMTSLGQRAEQGLAGMGSRMQQAGAQRGAAIQGRLAGPAVPAAPKPMPGNVESGPYRPPMNSMSEQYNPFHGMVGSLASSGGEALRNLGGLVGVRQNPAPVMAQAPAAAARTSPSYGTLAPAM